MNELNRDFKENSQNNNINNSEQKKLSNSSIYPISFKKIIF